MSFELTHKCQTESPDWVRLHKALAVEAERALQTLWKQYRFGVSLSLQFWQTPGAHCVASGHSPRWQEMAAQFASYLS